VASIYARGNRLWARLKGPQGWYGKATKHVVGEEAKAQRYADHAQALLDAKREGAAAGPLTVAAWAERWLATRREKYEATRTRYLATGGGKVQHRSHGSDRTNLRLHVLPHLGKRLVADVTAQDLANLIHLLRTTTPLSGTTIRNVYGTVVAMFRDAAVAGEVASTPCILTATHLGDRDDVDGAGRYTREQLELMLGAVALPELQRVFAALAGLTGLRLGGVAGLRWGDLDTAPAPLWRLTSVRTYRDKPTKTQRPSVIPVHPVLAEMLTTWRHSWGRLIGRPPTAVDPIIPRLPEATKGQVNDGLTHTKRTAGKIMRTMLDALDIPAASMPMHALRSTFISVALEDGAQREMIKRITHAAGQGRDAFDRYDRADYWPKLCAEVGKIRVTPRSGGSVVAASFATARATGHLVSGGKASDPMRMDSVENMVPPGTVKEPVADLGTSSRATRRKNGSGQDVEDPSVSAAVANVLQAIAEAAAAGDVERVLALSDELRAATGQGGALRVVR